MSVTLGHSRAFGVQAVQLQQGKACCRLLQESRFASLQGPTHVSFSRKGKRDGTSSRKLLWKLPTWNFDPLLDTLSLYIICTTSSEGVVFLAYRCVIKIVRLRCTLKPRPLSATCQQQKLRKPSRYSTCSFNPLENEACGRSAFGPSAVSRLSCLSLWHIRPSSLSRTQCNRSQYLDPSNEVRKWLFLSHIWLVAIFPRTQSIVLGLLSHGLHKTSTGCGSTLFCRGTILSRPVVSYSYIALPRMLSTCMSRMSFVAEVLVAIWAILLQACVAQACH